MGEKGFFSIRTRDDLDRAGMAASRWSEGFRKERLKAVGLEFMELMQSGEMSGQDLMAFAKEKGLSIEEMRDLAVIVKYYQSVEKNVDPEFGPVQMAKEGDGSNLPPGTVYQMSPKNELKVISSPTKGKKKQVTLYGKDGQSMLKTIPEDEDFTPEEGLSLDKPEKAKAEKDVWLQPTTPAGAYPKSYPESKAKELIERNPDFYEAAPSPLEVPKEEKPWKPLTKKDQLAWEREKAEAAGKGDASMKNDPLYDDIRALFGSAFDAPTPEGSARITRAYKYAKNLIAQNVDRAEAIDQARERVMREGEIDRLGDPPAPMALGLNKSAARAWAKKAKAAGVDPDEMLASLEAAGWENASEILKAIGVEPASKPGAPPLTRGAAPAKKKVVRTGTHKGRKVVQYEDGTVGYVD